MSKTPQKQPSSGHVVALVKPEEDEGQAVARTVLNPAVQGAATLKEYGSDLDITGLVQALEAQVDATVGRDLSRCEAMLTAQAHTLDAIFNTLARRAASVQSTKSMDAFLRLALRSQSQCRTTWEAVSAIQNPKVAGFVQQANIANGPQQVNNDSRTDEGRLRKAN